VTESSRGSTGDPFSATIKDRLEHAQMRKPSQESQETAKKKKSSWFKRLSKSEMDHVTAQADDSANTSMDSKDRQPSDPDLNGSLSKKKGFNLAFWKNTKMKDMSMSIQGRFSHLFVEFSFLADHG
jgi:hypothetical protein